MAAGVGIAPTLLGLQSSVQTIYIGNWSARQDLHLRSLGPKPSMLLLHYALFGPSDRGGRWGLGSCGDGTLSFPGTTSVGRSRKPVVSMVGDIIESNVPSPPPSQRSSGEASRPLHLIEEGECPAMFLYFRIPLVGGTRAPPTAALYLSDKLVAGMGITPI